jgi:hypothetical protein
MVASEVSLRKIFMALQNQMIQKLSSGREVIFHPTERGDFSEVNWVDWFRQYLPRRYSVDKAFVVDSCDRFSQQIDLVVYDNLYTPFVFNEGNAIYVPAEAVYAVFEVKQDLTREHLLYTGEKVKSVRTLKRTSGKILQASGPIDNPRLPFRILGGILTTVTAISEDPATWLKRNLCDLDSDSAIEIGCVLNRCAFQILAEDSETEIKVSLPDETLMFLFLKLLALLKALGTVPAIDIDQYANGITNF